MDVPVERTGTYIQRAWNDSTDSSLVQFITRNGAVRGAVLLHNWVAAFATMTIIRAGRGSPELPSSAHHYLPPSPHRE